MSGVAKFVKKVFKTVGKVFKKIAAPVLAVAGIVFTAGAALGIPILAGGLGGAVNAGLGALGINTAGTVGSTLAGAITHAGYGAALGGVTSAVTGGDFMKGAAMGALGGAVTGGVGGFMKGMAPATATQAATMSSRSLPVNGVSPMPRPTGTGVAAPIVEGAASAGPAATGTGFGGIAGKVAGVTGNLLDRPGMGNLIAGLGQGLLTGMAQKEEAELYREKLEADEEEQERRTASYEGMQPMEQAYLAPQPKIDPRRPVRRYRFDRSSGSIVYG
jgi:hypothetical protein